MYFSEAVARELDVQGRALLTEYDFFLVMHQVFERHQQSRLQIRNPPRDFDIVVVRRTIRQLERRKLIVRDPDFRGEVWQVLQATPIGTAEEAICLIDPFAYVAFLSALERHGLTNRSPKSLQMLTLSSPYWGKERRALMREQLPDTLIGESIPTPVHIQHREIVRRRTINSFQTKHLGQTLIIRGTSIRVSTVGQAFLDGLDQPSLCGGMRHVIQIWKEHAATYQTEIIDVVQQRASPINKVRAGYILETFADIRRPEIEAWTKFAQRGGSRKLDPGAPYAPTFSEKWMISLNV